MVNLTDLMAASDLRLHLLNKEIAGCMFPSIEDRGAWERIPEALRTDWINEAELYLNYECPSLRASAFMACFTEGSRGGFNLWFYRAS